MSFIAPGDGVAGYLVRNVLGVGSATVVYEVADADGQRWALKLMDDDAPEPLADELFERFERVVELGRRVRHPSLIIGHRAGRHAGRPFLVARLSPGVPLKRLRREMPRSVPLALSVTSALATALRAAHDARITHRDVKPSNVLVVRDEHEAVLRVDLVDFALARAPGVPKLTTAGRPIGTMGFAAPELLAGVDAGPSSDVFTLGVLAYLLLAGELPYPGAEPETYRAALDAGTPSPPPATPGPVWEVLARCLILEPRQRYRNAGQVCDALAELGLEAAERSR